MTAQTPRILTDAETSLVDAYAGASGWLPGEGVVKGARQLAVEALKNNGLPTRKVEAFHYTDLRALLAKGFRASPRPDATAAAERASNYSRLMNAVRLPVMDGHYFADLADDLPSGLTVMPSFLEGFGSGTGETADVVDTINTAFVTDGLNISVAADAKIDALIGIANTFAGEAGGIAATRNFITLEAGSNAAFLDRAVGPDDLSYLTSTVTTLTIGEGATADYVIAQEEGDAAQRLARFNVSLGKDATLNLFILNAGGSMVRQEINFDVEGEGAELNISGVNLIGGKAHIDVTSRITHHVPQTNATETFRNVATGAGQGVFQGQINVAQPAQLTDARMACNTLLLSDDCDFSAKPELEIFADDVQCAHGATVTDLEDSYLFYLMARGIPESTARRMLIRAFVAEVVEELENEALIEALEGRIDAWMERHV